MLGSRRPYVRIHGGRFASKGYPEIVMPLHPNVSKERKNENSGHLLEESVVINIDSGPGRLTEPTDNIIFSENIHEEGVTVKLGSS